MVDEAMREAYLDAKRRGLIGGTAKTPTVMYSERLMEQLQIMKDRAAEALRIEQILWEEGILKDEYRVIYSTKDVRELGIKEQYGPRGSTPEEAQNLLEEKLISIWLIIPEGTEFLRVEHRVKVLIESTSWA